MAHSLPFQPSPFLVNYFWFPVLPLLHFLIYFYTECLTQAPNFSCLIPYSLLTGLPAYTNNSQNPILPWGQSDFSPKLKFKKKPHLWSKPSATFPTHLKHITLNYLAITNFSDCLCFQYILYHYNTVQLAIHFWSLDQAI